MAWFSLGLTTFRMGYFHQALNHLARAERCGYTTTSIPEMRGDANYNLGEFEEARGSYEGALKREPRNVILEAKLGLAIVRAGSADKGIARLRSAIGASPQVAELHEGLILALVFLDQIDEAARAAEEKLDAVPGLLLGDYLRAASLWAQVSEWRHVGKVLERGLRAYPGSTELSQALEEVLHTSGKGQAQVS